MLTRLQLNNVCQHETLDVSFLPGVNGIVGGNGCGKSNTIRSIEWLLTGTFPGFGSRERKIRTGADKGSGTLNFEHHGQSVEVSRMLHTSRATLKVGDEPTTTGAEAVNARLAKLLGVSAKLMGQYVFVSQGATNAVLRSTPARRMEAFHLLFGLDGCEKLRKILADELQTYVPVSLAINRDGLAARRHEARQRLAEVEAELARAPAACDPATLADLRRRLSDAAINEQRLNHPQTGLEAVRRGIESEKALLAEAETGMEIARESEDGARRLAESLAASVASHRAVLEQSAQSLAVRSARQAAAADVDRLSRQMDALTVPSVPPDEDADVEKLVTGSLVPLEAKVGRMRSFVGGFSKGACPTCGTHRIVDSAGATVDIPARLVEYSHALQNLEPQAKALRAEVDGYYAGRSAAAEAYRVWEQQRAHLTAQLAGARAQLSRLPDVPEVSDTAARAALAECHAAEETYRKVGQTARDCRQRAMSHTLELNRLRTLLVELESLNVGGAVPVAELRRQVTAAESAAAEVSRLGGCRSELVRTVHSLQQQMQELDALEARNQGVTAYRRLLSEASGALHRDALPAAFSRRHFAGLNTGWNQMLEILDVPFSVRLQDDASVSLRFDDAERFIEEASGGQLCCASLAFMLEVNRRFASSIGFMALDEPTDGVDTAHLDRVRALFQEVQRYSSGSGTQLLVVTHAEQLSSGFNHVIRL